MPRRRSLASRVVGRPNFVAERRRLKGLSQEELAERSGVSQGTVSAVERQAQWPAFQTWQALADALDCNFLELFFNPEEPSADAILAEFSPAARRQAITVIRALKEANDEGSGTE